MDAKYVLEEIDRFRDLYENAKMIENVKERTDELDAIAKQIDVFKKLGGLIASPALKKLQERNPSPINSTKMRQQIKLPGE